MKNKLKKAKDLLQEAEAELKKYKFTKNFTYSSQACEKCWVACNLIIEQKAGIELRTGSIEGVMPYAEKVGMANITQACFTLHVYHYEGSQAYSEKDLIYSLKNAITTLRKKSGGTN